ncbi:serine/threonine protein kinase [Paramagnetospirillum kuznetsovii]|uniref:Serine/threonine protein kinase n=1 Tax=Paramagnetospirillum kuznetsovii TaxID=2053833 RepID=A0A364NU77_9PROT|nr:serine/threonine-protein kinase [Paramagnetospirillum kuznetsovii]RAU20649.1 serine/threonine protein kinase [Paramagnetospirillum kuznetsovii]
MNRAVPGLAGWRFHRRLISTDFSEIWLAEDAALGRPVAVKIFAPKADDQGMIPPFHVDEWRRRFFQEARLMARFDHPHIVPVVALSALDDGRPALFMQYMTGSLMTEIGTDIFAPKERAAQPPEQQSRAVSPGRTKQILVEVLMALTAIHERGVVHRDLKPRNVLLCNGPGSRLKISDFGMAKTSDEARSKDSIWFGTRDYIAPEQYANATHATDRSDIFSVGVIGIRLLTGHFPDRERLRTLEGCPAALIDLLSEALSQQPSMRPGARDMLRRLVDISL